MRKRTRKAQGQPRRLGPPRIKKSSWWSAGRTRFSFPGEWLIERASLLPADLVRLRSQIRGPQGQFWRNDPVIFADSDVLYTDSDGRFQSPSAVPAGQEYEATVVARDARPGRTGWLKTDKGPVATFADLVLHRIAAFDGIVRDRAGKPVSGATVFQSGDGPMRTRTLTDSDGRFRLPGVIAGKAILFVQKDGFHFHGQPVDTQSGPADLVLTRVEEAPLTVLKTRTGVLPHAEEMSVARRLLAPYSRKSWPGAPTGRRARR